MSSRRLRRQPYSENSEIVPACQVGLPQDICAKCWFDTSGRSSAIDARTTRHGGYAVSQRIRKRIEEAFGWIKTIAAQEKTRLVAWAFTFAGTAYNLVRLPKLIVEAG